MFVVRRIEIDFLKPGRMDDVLEIVTSAPRSAAPALDFARTCGATGR